MSVKAMTWVFANSEAKLGTRLVLLALADYAHDDGSNAFPSVATLAHKARLSERQVQYALRRLEKSGAIERTGKHPSGTNVYSVLLGGADFAGVQSTTRKVPDSAPDPLEPSFSSKAVTSEVDVANGLRSAA